jgi:tRNA (cmo5U34)-methyltransferase
VGEQWHFDPDTYLAMVRDEVPTYDELQGRLAAATTAVAARRILDLGTGTGVTASRVLEVHAAASLVGIDSSDEMLGHARALLPDADLRVARLEDPLPEGPFDLVVSALAIHHLDGPAKSDLFARVAEVLVPGGRFVLLDVVVPEGDVDRPVPLDPEIDLPSPLADQLTWLADAGLVATVVHAEGDLAVVAADRPGD